MQIIKPENKCRLDYDEASETWVINSYDYQLWVVEANLDIEDVKFTVAVPEDEDGSIDVTWLKPGQKEVYQKTASNSKQSLLSKKEQELWKQGKESKKDLTP